MRKNNYQWTGKHAISSKKPIEKVLINYIIVKYFTPIYKTGALMSIIIFIDLKAASQFEATVAAQNAEDWSRHSPIYHFSTFGAGIKIYLNLRLMLNKRFQFYTNINV